MKNVIKSLYFIAAAVSALPLRASSGSSSVAGHRGPRSDLASVVQPLSGDVYVVQHAKYQDPAKWERNVRLSAILVDIARFTCALRGYIIGSTHGYEVECLRKSTDSSKLTHIITAKEIFNLPEIGTVLGTVGGSSYVVENIQNLDSINMVLITIALLS